MAIQFRTILSNFIPCHRVVGSSGKLVDYGGGLWRKQFLLDLERGQEADLTYYEWIADSTVDIGRGWGYVKGLGFKTLDNLVDNLVDRVSKNGFLLLNVGPKPDGTIPDEAKDLLLGMGKWLQVNGEAVYGTTPWGIAGEGPTKLPARGDYNEKNDMVYTGQDIRFTIKGDTLYATVLDWPGEKLLIKSLKPRVLSWTAWPGLYPSEIASVTMLGDGRELKWEVTQDGLSIEAPKTKPCDFLAGLRIAARTLWFVAQLEIAETRQLHALATLECGAHLLEERLHHVLCFTLVEADLLKQDVRQFRLGERGLADCCVVEQVMVIDSFDRRRS